MIMELIISENISQPINQMGQSKNHLSYVLITAAKNEEDYIRGTIESVAAQNITPELWVIVSDASTDKTDEIIKEYAAQYSFIKYVRAADQAERNFASKAFAINIGYKHIRNVEYNFIGILDADVTFQPDYIETIMKKFAEDPKLGIAGGIFYDVYNGKRHKVNPSVHSVRGAVQLFRRECYEDVNGMLPLRKGGIDTFAEISARKHGWKVKTFFDAEVLHHRCTGTSSMNLFQHKYRQGIVEHSLGYHPLYQAVKCCIRIFEKPYIIGAALRFAGYWNSYLKKETPTVPEDFFKFIRHEQKLRLRKVFFFKNKAF